jgi:hypothetical protein
MSASKSEELVRGLGCEESTDLSACRHVDSLFFRQKEIASRMRCKVLLALEGKRMQSNFQHADSVQGIQQTILVRRGLSLFAYSLYSPCYQRLARTLGSAREKA